MASQKDSLTQEQIDHIAREGGKAALRDLFKQLGYDTDDAKSLLALQDDWRYLRDERANTERVKENIAKTFWQILPMVVLGVASWAFFVFSSGLRSAMFRWLSSQ